MGGTVAALAVRNHLTIRRDSSIGVHLLQFSCGLELPRVREISRPLDMNGSGYGAAAASSHQRTLVFGIAARVEDDRVTSTDRILDVPPRGEHARIANARPVALRRRCRIARDRKSRRRPCAEPAIQQPYRRMA